MFNDSLMAVLTVWLFFNAGAVLSAVFGADLERFFSSNRDAKQA